MPGSDVGVRRVWIVAMLLVVQAVVVVVSINDAAFNADDVFFQDVWLRWRPFSEEFSLRRNTWILHVPIATVAEWAFGRSFLGLTTAAVVLNAVSLLLIARFVVFLGGRLGATRSRQDLAIATVGAWHVLASAAFLDFTARVNFRNLELGLHLAALMLLITAAEHPLQLRRSVLFGAGLALLFLNDPWSLFAAVVPVLVLISLRSALRRASCFEQRIAMILAGSVVAYLVLIVLLGSAGLTISDYAQPALADMGTIPNRVIRGVELLLITFGADLSWSERPTLENLAHLVRLATVVAAVVSIVRTLRRAKPDAVASLIGLGVLASGGFAAYVASDLDALAFDNDRFARYLMPVASATIAAVALPVSVASRRTVGFLVAAVALTTLANAGSVARTAVDLAKNGPDEYLLGDLEDLASDLERTGYQYGFGDYWSAAPLEYFARDNLIVSMVECPNGNIEQSGLSADEDLDLSVQQTFVISLDTEVPASCTPDDFIRQLGPIRHSAQHGRFRIHYFGSPPAQPDH